MSSSQTRHYDTARVILEIQERSMPDSKRPRLDEETESSLSDLDRRSARCYADAELRAHRLRQLASDIAEAPADVEQSAVPQPIEDGNDSLVLHIEDARAKLRPTGS